MLREEIEQIEIMVIEYCEDYNIATNMIDEKGMPTNDVWENHISLVRDNAVLMAKARGADVEVCELAALLHDIAALADHEGNRENHHIIGAKMADRILSEFEYPKEKLELVKKCILNHRGSVPGEKQSLEETIIADADAMSHLQKPESLLKLQLAQGKKLEEARAWVKNKLERTYSKMSDYAKAHNKDLYEHDICLYGSKGI